MKTAHMRGVLMLGSLLALWSCDQPVAGPIIPRLSHLHSASDSDAEHSRNPDLRPIAKFREKPAPPDPLNDHKMIGPEGGALRVGDYEIIVPAGAVDRATNFRIKRPVDPRAAEHAYAEFSPHINFSKPVIIRLPHRTTYARGTYIGWWSGERWIHLPTRLTEDGRIEAEVPHFSYYGTLLWGKGITTLGG